MLMYVYAYAYAYVYMYVYVCVCVHAFLALRPSIFSNFGFSDAWPPNDYEWGSGDGGVQWTRA